MLLSAVVSISITGRNQLFVTGTCGVCGFFVHIPFFVFF